MEELEEIYSNDRGRNWLCLFYDESIHYNFNDVIFNIHSLKYYAYIKHLPEEDEKLEHYHLYLQLDNPTTKEALSKRLGIPAQKIELVKNRRGAVRYLTHIDYPDKIQYDIDEIKVSGLFKRKFLKHFEDIKTEEEIIQELYNWIDTVHFDSYHEKLKYFIIFVNSNCYDTIFKRYRFEFTDYLKSNL